MRRSICSSEPPVARAGQASTWQFHYTTALPLPKGTRFKFDLLSKGRDIDWEIPSIDLSKPRNTIWAQLEEGQLLQGREIQSAEALSPQFEFTLPRALKVGEKITIVLGAPPQMEPDEEETGNECQLTLQRRRPFYLYIDPKGKGQYEEPELFTMDIRGNRLHSLRILAPSFVSKNKRFDITVRFEDAFGNLTNDAPADTLIDLTYEHLRENLNWKLFVPETGFVILPNLYFNEAGVYRIQLKNLKTKEVFSSAPIKCFQENDRMLCWGLLHGESDRVDSAENIEACLRHYRDEKALNFFATSYFDSAEETSNEIWKLASQTIAEFNEEERFIAMLGFQYVGEPGTEGLRHLIYTKDQKPLLRQKDTKSSSLMKIYKTNSSKELLAIASFTMAEGSHFDFEQFYPEFERVVEIYNAWGSSERKKGSRPITGGVETTPSGSIIEALKKNCRFGFVAGGLDDRGIYSEFYDSEQVQYSPGLTAVMCEKYTRESLLEALFRRSCYATTGARMIVGFYIAGHLMGSELSTAQKPGLIVNRHISGYVAGTAELKEVELLRNGEVIHRFHPKALHFDYYYDDQEPLDKIVLDGNGKDPFVFYYLRVTQEDGQLAWSSPIWVDLAPTGSAKGGKKADKG